MFSVLAVLIVQLRHVVADRRDLLLENAALRQQLAVYQRNTNRPKLTSADLWGPNNRSAVSHEYS
jgi:hypothetical protein